MNYLYKHLSRLKRYTASFIGGIYYHRKFKDIKSYCMFIGHGRSGHSIVGAFLDAHPNIIIADEVDTLRFLELGYSRDQIFYYLLSESRTHAKQKRQKSYRGKAYSYEVPGQWQGKFNECLTVIGANQADKATRRIAQEPSLLSRFQETTGMGVKFIQIVRNPYDSISTHTIKSGFDLRDTIDFYFNNCRCIMKIRPLIDKNDLLVLRHEAMINDPQTFIRELCSFLEVDAAKDYIESCASIVYTSPNKSRQQVNWDSCLVAMVEENMQGFDFLQGYTFSS